MSRISAFISYSHDSPEHAAQVLAFAQALGDNGIVVELDQFHSAEILDWPRWCNQQTSREFNDFVLCVCTGEYRLRIDGGAAPETGKGVHWEGSLLDDDLYDSKRNGRIVPILLGDESEREIPRFLRGWTRCRVKAFVLDDPGFEHLLRILTGQAPVVRQPTGPFPILPPQATGAKARRQAPGQVNEVPQHDPSRVAPSRLPHVAGELLGRDAEVVDLDKAWKPGSGIRVVTIVAWGGVGKTSLVAKWAATLSARDYDGASYFDWSFPSQGTPDQFIEAALEFFGDTKMARSPALAWDKGARLAELVAQRRTLLILDGLEALQRPPGPQTGELKDTATAVTALLRGLAGKNPGLCLVTSRARVTDLAQFRQSTAPEWKLEHLSDDASLALLENLGVKGPHDEIMRLVTDMQGHALTLFLLGKFLCDAHGGDISQREAVRLEEANREEGEHAFRVMDAYVKWFESEDEKGLRPLAVLRLLGLFDRPADAGSLAALRAGPPIPSLTEPLINLTLANWNVTVSRLVDSGLVTRDGENIPALDAHPMIREYFAKQLRDTQPKAFQAAHSRLFDHLCETTPHRPDTLDGLEPLYQAVAHGCLAGRQQEACAKVYVDRILRGEGSHGFYSIYKLGAVGADLAVLAAFFDESWTCVSPNLDEAAQAGVLSMTGFCLGALGRFSDALQRMRAGLEIYVQTKNSMRAATVASMLSELEVSLGRLTDALADAGQSITHADQSGDAFWRTASRTNAAVALYQSGRRAEAGTRFAEAEQIQKASRPQFDVLYWVQGFRYCEWLLAPAERAAWQALLGGTSFQPVMDKDGEVDLVGICDEVERRGKKMFEWRDSTDSRLTIALDHLTLAQVALIRKILARLLPQPTLDLPDVVAAVNGLRDAGQLQHLPKGLLTDALCRFVRGDAASARTALDQAQAIANRGPMPLYLADIHLHRARLFRDGAELAKARELIEKHGYWRCKEELEDAEAAARNWPT
jgi:tetratricopeptide (TPR) repeat protein